MLLRLRFSLPVLLVIAAACATPRDPVESRIPTAMPEPVFFDGDRAFQLAERFMEFGPRVTGSEESILAGDWILAELADRGWETFTDEGEYRQTRIRNLAGRRGAGSIVIVGAHYDSRRRADHDPDEPDLPVPGANDGASGVAVVLELARVLECDWQDRQVWLVLFDAEDNGGLDCWEWIVGARQFAALVRDSMDQGAVFDAMILVDMVGDADLQLHWERNSHPGLSKSIWEAAAILGYGDVFLAEYRYSMLDDHLPFRDLGIPAVDIIDFDYPYWHTREDTIDKLGRESLHTVGRTVEFWLENFSGWPLEGTPESARPSESGYPSSF